MDERHFLISPVPAERAAEVLRLVFLHLPQSQLVSTIASAMTDLARNPDRPTGVFQATLDGERVGAVWAQALPGAVAVLWPPGLIPTAPPGVARALIDAATESAQTSGAAIVQAIVSPDAQEAILWLREAGYADLAELDYLVCFSDRFPARPPALDLTFEPCTAHNRDRLEAIVAATYEKTLDCPAMSDLRAMGDVLEGYRATGDPERARWLIVQSENIDVGCLLLADHAPEDFWELVYMGLVESVRGRGFGLQVVRHAQWLCRQEGRDRLVLAVDRRNAPARRIYMSCGFWRWDERQVLLRSF